MTPTKCSVAETQGHQEGPGEVTGVAEGPSVEEGSLGTWDKGQDAAVAGELRTVVFIEGASPLPSAWILGGAGRDAGQGKRHTRNFFFSAGPCSAYLLFWCCATP